jgi:hypothetical protein
MIWLIAGYGLFRNHAAMRWCAIEHMTPEQLPDAWLLIHASGLQPSAQWWLSEAKRLINNDRRVLAARAPDGLVHGLVLYRIVGDERVGKRLSVESIITLELSHSAPVRRALCDALDELSLTLECDGIDVVEAQVGPG